METPLNPSVLAMLNTSLVSASLTQLNTKQGHTLLSTSTTSFYIHSSQALCRLPRSKHSPPLLAAEPLHSSSWQSSPFDQRPLKRSCWKRRRRRRRRYSVFPSWSSEVAMRLYFHCEQGQRTVRLVGFDSELDLDAAGLTAMN